MYFFKYFLYHASVRTHLLRLRRGRTELLVLNLGGCVAPGQEHMRWRGEELFRAAHFFKARKGCVRNASAGGRLWTCSAGFFHLFRFGPPSTKFRRVRVARPREPRPAGLPDSEALLTRCGAAEAQESCSWRSGGGKATRRKRCEKNKKRRSCEANCIRPRLCQTFVTFLENLRTFSALSGSNLQVQINN